MSINEIPSIGSNLTEKQQREAMAAVYDLQGAPMSPNIQTELTYEERVKMRRMLDELDQKQAGGMKEFDLNKPPVPPYVYREYPFLMYNHQTKQSRPALNHEQRQKMLAGGWSEEPVPAEIPEVELTVSERIQAEEIDRRLKMPKEQLEAEQSAEYVAALRREIAELKAARVPQEPQESEQAETAERAARKRSKT